MTYTLTTFALWLAAAAVIGLVTGWLLGRLWPGKRGAPPDDEAERDEGEAADMADRDIAEPAVAPATDPSREAEHYAVLTRLERVTAERDALRRQLDGQRGEAPPVAATVATPVADAPQGDADRLAKELRVRLWNAEATITELREQLRAAEGDEGRTNA